MGFSPPKKIEIGMNLPADLVFDPTLAVRSVRSYTYCAPLLTLSGFALDGLTSKPHHAPRRFGRITWIVLPATGIDFQPQTRYEHPRILYALRKKNASGFTKFFTVSRLSCPKKLIFCKHITLETVPHHPLPSCLLWPRQTR